MKNTEKTDILEPSPDAAPAIARASSIVGVHCRSFTRNDELLRNVLVMYMSGSSTMIVSSTANRGILCIVV